MILVPNFAFIVQMPGNQGRAVALFEEVPYIESICKHLVAWNIRSAERTIQKFSDKAREIGEARAAVIMMADVTVLPEE
jgi:hypothetical protein